MPLDSNLPLVWLAGGIGITPFRSMATWLADNRETRNINFFQSISQPEDAIFEDVLIAAGINQRQRIASSGTHASRLDAAMVLRSVADPTAAYYYLAGPEAMVAALATELLAADIPRHQIISDIFLGYR